MTTVTYVNLSDSKPTCQIKGVGAFVFRCLGLGVSPREARSRFWFTVFTGLHGKAPLPKEWGATVSRKRLRRRPFAVSHSQRS